MSDNSQEKKDTAQTSENETPQQPESTDEGCCCCGCGDDHIKEPKKEKTGKAENIPDFDLSMLLPESVDEILRLQVLQMREWAYIYLGLNPHPKHKKIITDIRQAKMAVDTAAAIAEVLLPHLPAEEQRQIKILISDLKMNFISKQNQG